MSFITKNKFKKITANSPICKNATKKMVIWFQCQYKRSRKTKANIYLFNYQLQYNYKFYSKLSNFDHVLGIVSQKRISGGNRIYDPHANSLVHHSPDYQGTRP